jgi:hypothetical protein
LAHVPCPLMLLLQQQEEQQQQQELLALSVLRALQLQPQLLSGWRGSLWFQLLHHALPVVRWAAVRGVSLMLASTDAVTTKLLDAHLDTQQQVQAAARWVAVLMLWPASLALGGGVARDGSCCRHRGQEGHSSELWGV